MGRHGPRGEIARVQWVDPVFGLVALRINPKLARYNMPQRTLYGQYLNDRGRALHGHISAATFEKRWGQRFLIDLDGQRWPFPTDLDEIRLAEAQLTYAERRLYFSNPLGYARAA